MPRDNDLREFTERYKDMPDKKLKRQEEDDQPRIVEETDTRDKSNPPSPVIAIPRKCKVHRTRIEGINYHCHECGSVFCLACITNVLLPEGKCMVCEAEVNISDEFRSLIDRTARQVDPDAFTMSGQVTTIAPEIWHRFEELQLDEDVVDEIIDRLKYVPPEDRMKFLNAYFNDQEENEDQI
jgi:hypothetical protein